MTFPPHPPYGRQHTSSLFISQHALLRASQVPCPLPLPGSRPAQLLWGDSRLKPPSGLPRRQCRLSALEPSSCGCREARGQGKLSSGRRMGEDPRRTPKGPLTGTQKETRTPQSQVQCWKTICKTDKVLPWEMLEGVQLSGSLHPNPDRTYALRPLDCTKDQKMTRLRQMKTDALLGKFFPIKCSEVHSGWRGKCKFLVYTKPKQCLLCTVK